MDSQDLVLIDDETLNQVRDILVKRQETLAVAESVTAGVLQTAMASAMDASMYFHGGITAYNLGQKARHLHVNPIHADACNCVSEQVAEEMALNVCDLFSSDWGVGVTGFATIDPVAKNRLPFAHFSIAYRGEILKSCFLEHEKGNPGLIQYFYVSEILKVLLRILTHKKYK
jgi:nicotinamide-nucleotide amidase